MAKKNNSVAQAAAGETKFVGGDKLLLGIVLAVLTYWLFAGTLGTW